MDRFFFYVSMGTDVNRITNKVELMIDSDLYNEGHMRDQIGEFCKQAVAIMKKAKTGWLNLEMYTFTNDHKRENFMGAERFGLEKNGSTYQFSEYKGQNQWVKYGILEDGLKSAIEYVMTV